MLNVHTHKSGLKKKQQQQLLETFFNLGIAKLCNGKYVLSDVIILLFEICIGGGRFLGSCKKYGIYKIIILPYSS